METFSKPVLLNYELRLEHQLDDIISTLDNPNLTVTSLINAQRGLNKLIDYSEDKMALLSDLFTKLKSHERKASVNINAFRRLMQKMNDEACVILTKINFRE